jgi:hypothetical protein
MIDAIRSAKAHTMYEQEEPASKYVWIVYPIANALRVGSLIADARLKTRG